MCGIPVAIGIAVLRYRLYGIDVLIRRTVTYTALVAVLAAVYLGCVVVLEAGLQSVSGQSGSIAVTLSTLAVAGLFGPALRGSGGRSTGGSHAASTTGRRRSRSSRAGCGTRSTSRRSRSS